VPFVLASGFDQYGCLFPGECLMGRSFHYRSQCHTSIAPETPEAPGGRTNDAEPATRGAEPSRRPTPTPGQGAPAARERRPQAPSEPRNPEAAGTRRTAELTLIPGWMAALAAFGELVRLLL
jgi:hypothetical protein